jgi:SAM-dependent methyltransferase
MTDPLLEWFESPRGRALRNLEARVLAEALDDCFGWELLQLGAWGASRDLIAGSRTRRQTVIASADLDPGRAAGRATADVHARLTQLPVASDSVDAIVLPHTLEFEADPYTLLREADRTLTGEGKLLVLGFRPLSAWGLRAAASRRGFPPGLRRLLSERRVRDWLSLLGYEVAQSRGYLYELPWGEAAAELRRRRGLFYPLPAGAYLLKARKRVFAIPAQRLRLVERARTIGGLEPTSANRT